MTDKSKESDADLMARYGITCVPIDQFHFKSFRYLDLGSAVNQARRDEAQTKP